MTAEGSAAGSISLIFARRFILISLVYFVIGTLWMGPLSTFIPGPSGEAGVAFDTAKMHLVFIGFVAFAIIGMMYYISSKIGGRDLYSKRLGTIHFWTSIAFLPITVIIEIWAVLTYEDVINAPGFSPSNIPPALTGVFILALLLYFVGIGAQALFGYNIYKTMKS